MHSLSFYFHYRSMYAFPFSFHFRFCLKCNDMVYSRVVDGIFDFISGFQDGQRALPYVKYIHDEKPLDQTSNIHFPQYVQAPKRTYFLCFKTHILVVGLKGMLNMGRTDGLSSILQLYMHLPFLRDFFLSDRHSPLQCFLKSDYTNGSLQACFLCALRKLIRDLYEDNNNRFVLPKDILSNLWVFVSSRQSDPLSFRVIHDVFISHLGKFLV